MKKLIIILLCILLSGCTKELDLNYYTARTTTSGFDTFISFSAYMENEEDFNSLADEVFDEFSYYNQLFDSFNAYENINNIHTINQNAGITPIVVEQEIIDLLLEAKDFYDLTEGHFNVTSGNLFSLWRDYIDDGSAKNFDGIYGELPTDIEIDEALKCSGFEYIEINDSENTVYINNPCVKLDVGAIAKGYTTQIIAAKLQESNIIGIISAGGSSNHLINTKRDNEPWIVGLKNPDEYFGDPLLKLNIDTSTAVVTSGDSVRSYYAEDFMLYHHIIDPISGYPSNHYRSVTITLNNSSYADILSTVLYTVDIEDGLKIIDAFEDKYNLDLEVVWILDNNTELTHTNEFILDDYKIITTNDINKHLIYE